MYLYKKKNMKFIITESQKNLLIRKFINEDETGGIKIGDIANQALEYAKQLAKNPKQSSDTQDISTDNVVGSGSFGNVKLTGNFDSTKKNNISLLIDAMKEKGITDPLTQIGILSVIMKESNFIPKGEVSYAGTPNSRIRGLFGSRVKNLSDSQLNDLKSDPRKFFNLVYSTTVGNQGGDDGWTFRGRGFNQLTGRKNYRKYGQLAGINLESDPELLNRNDVAAKVAIQFLTKGKTNFPKFNSKEEAATYFADINSGGGVSSHRGKAVESSKSFDVA
jgi:putative chitinase